MIAHAQESVELAHSFVAKLNEVILFPLITLLTVVALVIFLWGCFQFVYYASSDSKRAEGRQHIMWGIVGLLVMLSAFTILSIAANTFGIDADEYRGGDASLAPTSSVRPPTRPDAFPSTDTTTGDGAVASTNNTTFSDQELLNRYNDIPGNEQGTRVLFAEEFNSEIDWKTPKTTCQNAGGRYSSPFAMLNGEGMQDNVIVVACFQ